MGSTVIPISDDQGFADLKERRKFLVSLSPIVSFVQKNKDSMKKIIHCIKVGTALVLVSLVYFDGRLYKEIGDDNAMWAMMTVVVIFELHAGATLGKGFYRGIGTVLGGGLGCIAAILGDQVGGIGNPFIVGVSLFIFGGAATYARLIPNIKKRYDYGIMIFILTFNLVSVSGLREENVMEIARERLMMIVIGFVICICTTLFFYPTWASDEIHNSMVSKFEDLASSIEGCVDEYFRLVGDKENQSVHPIASFRNCISVLNSKARDESLVNFAKWEPWHGKFGLFHPWEKYQKIGEVLREVAAITLSLKGSLNSSKEPLQALRESIKEPCEAAGLSLAWTLRELGESIKKMRRCQSEPFIVPKLKLARQGLSQVMSPFKLGKHDTAEGLAIACFVFSLMELAEKLKGLAKEVEELGELAGFNRS
ncbi:PREDICTED: aluminum-activated malate transporter 2-like [Populus euphratica]|uniref:Aluminum-activated malate transporter 2-like n=1 Tax=Populus euphratica TaxID=75702 RepID=A0AAJ6XP66_POPEU|nr:PREDICTED: aluminum-activated malate transporter 2-like [Populus euphratica]